MVSKLQTNDAHFTDANQQQSSKKIWSFQGTEMNEKGMDETFFAVAAHYS